jgi:hypothetical protein
VRLRSIRREPGGRFVQVWPLPRSGLRREPGGRFVQAWPLPRSGAASRARRSVHPGVAAASIRGCVASRQLVLAQARP